MSNYQTAQEILGDNFISPLDIPRPGYTPEQLHSFENGLPNQEELTSLKKNKMVLIAGPSLPLSLLQVIGSHTSHFHKHAGRSWYEDYNQRFTTLDRVGSNWIAVSKEPLPGSLRQNLYEQTKLLGKGPIVANAAEVAWVLTMYKEVRGVSMMPTTYTRTFSVTANGDRVDVGGDPIYIFYSEKGERREGLGLVACRRYFF